MATEARMRPGWGHVAALRQAIRERRGMAADAGAILWRRKLLIFACLGIVLALTALYVSTLTPTYQAEALVGLSGHLGEQVGPDTRVRDGSLEEQLRLIESRAMAARLVDRLDLHLLREFRPDAATRDFRLGPVLGRWLPDVILDRLPKAWAKKLLPPLPDAEMTDEQRAARLWGEVIEATMARIRAEIPAPSTIGLKFLSEDRQLAAAGANALADLYFEQRPTLRQNAPQSDRDTREQEIERLRGSIRETEQAIEAARLGADAATGANREQRRLDLTGELAFWRRERAEVEARRRHVQAAVESGTGLDQLGVLIDSERLGQLQARTTELQQQLAALAQQHGEEDPQVTELRAQLAALEQERRAEIGQSLQQLQDELAIIHSRETALAAEIEALEQQSGEGEAERGLATLEQRLEADRARLRNYVEQAAEQLGTQPSAAPVIARAVAPERPTYPRLALIWGAASAGALLLGTLLALALEGVGRRRA
jgi:uncharacterized protein involved in exopolysaccharide biosynthesis